MSSTIRSAANVLRRVLPAPLWRAGRSVATAILTPLAFSYRTGHLRSSFQNLAVTAEGEPLPWYTYPCIDFLAQRDFAGMRVLEFGAGQSTVWWSNRAAKVVSIETDPAWHDRIKARLPTNVELHLVPAEREPGLAAIRALTQSWRGETFDVVIIDGLWRRRLVALAFEHVAEGGVVIFDNADRYELHVQARDFGYMRADFYGFAPGVLAEACTSIFFQPGSALFSPAHPIPRVRSADAPPPQPRPTSQPSR